MLLLVFLLFICCANAYSPRCTDMNVTSMTFRPTEDGVVGRYRAELCTVRNPNVINWTINLSYNSATQCCNGTKDAATRRCTLRHGPDHSSNTVPIEFTNNCTHVCYSMDLDLIFSSCYAIKSTMTVTEGYGQPAYDTFHSVTNNLTIESIRSNKPYVNFVNHEDHVILIWYLGIPPTNYRVTLCQLKDATGADIPGACLGDLPSVTDNCTSDELLNELQCWFSPPYGLHEATVEHLAPWTGGVFRPQQYTTYKFNHSAVSDPHVPGPGARGGAAAVWWACGAALLLAAAALAAVAARRAMRRWAYHKRLFAEWPPLRSDSEPSTPGVSELGPRPILVLYAREGERGQLIIKKLVELLQQATSSPVYDLFSAEVMSLSARAPHAWLDAALAARGARVLLLQTPALHALYRTHLDAADAADANLKLAEPLLGRRVAYREPHFADDMLQYALRLIVINAHALHAYDKYYLATLSELPADILQQVVPFRRYPLPHAAATLLQHLAGPGQPATPDPGQPATPDPGQPATPDPGQPATPDPLLLQQLEHAIEQYVKHATDNPNYLMDELLVIPGN